MAPPANTSTTSISDAEESMGPPHLVSARKPEGLANLRIRSGSGGSSAEESADDLPALATPAAAAATPRVGLISTAKASVGGQGLATTTPPPRVTINDETTRNKEERVRGTGENEIERGRARNRKSPCTPSHVAEQVGEKPTHSRTRTSVSPSKKLKREDNGSGSGSANASSEGGASSHTGITPRLRHMSSK